MTDALTRLAALSLDPEAPHAVSVTVDGGVVMVAQEARPGVEILRWTGTPAEWEAAVIAAREEATKDA